MGNNCKLQKKETVVKKSPLLYPGWESNPHSVARTGF